MFKTTLQQLRGGPEVQERTASQMAELLQSHLASLGKCIYGLLIVRRGTYKSNVFNYQKHKKGLYPYRGQL